MAEAEGSGIPSKEVDASKAVNGVATVAKQHRSGSGKDDGQNPIPGNHSFVESFETKFFGSFVDPMLSKMEERVSKATEVLDEMQKKLDEEREEDRRKELSKHIPETIKGHGQELPEIMKNLEDLIMYYDSESHDHTIKARLKELTPGLQTVLTSYSIAAYASTLDPPHLQQLSRRLLRDVSDWLSRLFRLENGSAFIHEEEREGLLRVCRLAIMKRFPEYVGNGYEVFQDKQPVVYLSGTSHSATGHLLCTQLGLPSTSCYRVPLYKNTHRMDVAALSKQIQADKEQGRVPTLLVAYAGTPILGHVDDFKLLHEICSREKIWLHIEGNCVSLLTYMTVPTNIRPVKSGDSLALNLSSWLGVPALPYVTLYRLPDPTSDGRDDARAAGLVHITPRTRLLALPLWVTLQSLGHYGILEKISKAVNMAKKVHTKVNSTDTLRNVTLFEIENPTVVFRYCSAGDNPDNKKEGQTDEKQDEDSAQLSSRLLYYDALNNWLCDMVKRHFPKLGIHPIDVPGEGYCIRFAPMETIHDYDVGEAEVDEVIEYLERQLNIVDATVSKKQELAQLVSLKEGLELVTLSRWAGLGAVQYIPSHMREEASDWSAAAINELNNVNFELVQRLKAQDTAFSLGKTSNDLCCLRFGLITAGTDLNELLDLISVTAQEVEESSKFLETMAENIRKGIEKAEHDLHKENQDKLVQEGVLRQIPMVGSLLNWWSPPPKDLVKGRTFDLTSGSVQSTEETYKHKMQIQQDGGSPSPPSPSSPKPQSQPIAVPNGPAPPELYMTMTPGDSPVPSPKGALELKSTPVGGDHVPRLVLQEKTMEVDQSGDAKPATELPLD